MAEDVNALCASTLERGKNVRKSAATVEQVVEIPFWLYPNKPKWVSGIRSHTTCRDILLSLVRSDANKMFEESDVFEKRLVLVEQWRGVEKPLAPGLNILKIWSAWGDERHQVRFVVKRMSMRNIDSKMTRLADTAKNIVACDSKRRMGRRRNSISSAGSFADEPHPRRLAKMTENTDMPTKYANTPAKCANMLTKYADMHMPTKYTDMSKKKGKAEEDLFDEHIEEMMKIIVVQGKRICEELKRVQQDVSSSNPKSSQDRKSRRRKDDSIPSQKDASKLYNSTSEERTPLQNITTNGQMSFQTNSVPNQMSLNHKPIDHLTQDQSSQDHPSPSDNSEKSADKITPNGCKSKNDNSVADISIHSQSLPVKVTELSLNDTPPAKVVDSSNRRVRMLPKIPLNAKIFDINKSLGDISKLNTSQDSSTSDTLKTGDVKRTLLSRANSTLDCSTLRHLKSSPSLNAEIDNTKQITSSNPSLDTLNTSNDSSNASFSGVRNFFTQSRLGTRANSFLDLSRSNPSGPSSDSSKGDTLNASIDSSNSSQKDISYKTLGRRANSSLEMSRNLQQPSLNSSIQENSIQSLSRSQTDLSKRDSSLTDSSGIGSGQWSTSEIVENLEVFSVELSNLAKVNDKLQFAEESVDRLEIALAQQHQHLQLQQLRRTGSIPNLTLDSDSAQEHLFCARSEVERLRVINENVGREIAENQKHLHNLDAAVKAKRSALKHLEYDVNVIEKEGRKLAKELDKVLNIRIEEIFVHEDEKLLLLQDSNDSAEIEIESELTVLTEETENAKSGKLILSGHSSFDPSGRTSATGTPESSSSGNSSGSSSEKSVRFCLDRRKADSSMTSSPGRFVKSPGKIRESSGDADNNSDTGLSSLHSSSDEGTYEIGTLV